MPFRGLANRRQRYRPADLPLALLPFDPAIQRIALDRHAAGLLDQPPHLGHRQLLRRIASRRRGRSSRGPPCRRCRRPR